MPDLKTETTATRLPNVFPFLRDDDAASMEWFARAFGFETKFVTPSDDATIAHAKMRVGRGRVALMSSKNDQLGLRTPPGLCGVSQAVYVYLADVHEHFGRAAGAEIVRALEKADYESRDHTARDSERNLWACGSYQLAADE